MTIDINRISTLLSIAKASLAWPPMQPLHNYAMQELSVATDELSKLEADKRVADAKKATDEAVRKEAALIKPPYAAPTPPTQPYGLERTGAQPNETVGRKLSDG